MKDAYLLELKFIREKEDPTNLLATLPGHFLLENKETAEQTISFFRQILNKNVKLKSKITKKKVKDSEYVMSRDEVVAVLFKSFASKNKGRIILLDEENENKLREVRSKAEANVIYTDIEGKPKNEAVSLNECSVVIDDVQYAVVFGLFSCDDGVSYKIVHITNPTPDADMDAVEIICRKLGYSKPPVLNKMEIGDDFVEVMEFDDDTVKENKQL